LTVTSLPALHLPDEPTLRAQAWLAAVLDGGDLSATLQADDGLINWLWSRWSTLQTFDLTKEAFGQIVLAYQREVWLWLAGERTWAQSCSGLMGRVGRRIVQVNASAG
jgi:hypothetical protein